MKTLIVTAIMGATVATAHATMNPVNPDMETEAVSVAIDQQTQSFIDEVAMLEWRVDAAWQQYDHAVAAIEAKPGSVKDLQSQMHALIKFYQDDIDQGVRLQDSRKAIDEIYSLYSKKIDTQAKVEAPQVARLQFLLGAEIDRGERELEALLQANASHVNAHSEPVIRSAQRKFVNGALSLKALKESAALASR